MEVIIKKVYKAVGYEKVLSRFNCSFDRYGFIEWWRNAREVTNHPLLKKGEGKIKEYGTRRMDMP